MPVPDSWDVHWSDGPGEDGSRWCIVKVYGDWEADGSTCDADSLQARGRAPRSEPGNPQGPEVAAAYLTEGRYDEAMELIGGTLEQSSPTESPDFVPPDVWGRFHEGLELHGKSMEFLRDRQFDLAREGLQRLTDMAPNWCSAWSNLGLCDLYSGFVARAEQSLRRALTLRPEHPMVHCNVGLVSLTKGDYANAIQYEQRALRAIPEYPEARQNLLDAKRLKERTQTHRQGTSATLDPRMDGWPAASGSAQSSMASYTGPCPPLRGKWGAECDAADASVVVAEGRVFCCVMGRELLCLDAFTGKQYWRAGASVAFITSPFVDGGRAYVGSEDGTVHCLDVLSGEQEWDFATGAALSGPPVVVGEQVLISTQGGNLCSLSPSGDLVWKLDTMCAAASPPACESKDLYVSCSDGSIRCIARETGEARWSFAACGGSGRMAPVCPAVTHGRVYVPGHDGSSDGKRDALLCLDAEDGEVVWRYEWPRDRRIPNTDHAVSHGTVYQIGADGQLVAIRDGAVCWSSAPLLACHGGLPSSPTAAGEHIYLSSPDGTISCINEDTGQEDWSCRLALPDGGHLSSPSVAYNRLYFSAGTRGVVCLEEDS